MKRLTRRAYVALMIVGNLTIFSAAFLFYLTSSPAQARARVEWDHGVILPASALVVREERTGWFYIDGHASTEVQMPAGELPGFLAQLHPAQKRFTGKVWTSRDKDGSTRYQCEPSGENDAFKVVVHPVHEGTVRVGLVSLRD